MKRTVKLVKIDSGPKGEKERNTLKKDEHYLLQESTENQANCVC